MQYTALWGPKGFLVTSSKVVPLMDLATTISVKVETQNDTSGSAQTNIISRELQQVTLSTIYLRAAGVDPRGQIAEWEALVGKAHPLIIENKRFGPAKLMLKSVSATDVLTTATGKFLQVKISLTFEEYVDNSAVSVSSTANANKTALSTGASPADRAQKKAVTVVSIS